MTFQDQFVAAVEKLQATDEQLARLLDTARSTIRYWKSGLYSPHPLMERMVLEKLAIHHVVWSNQPDIYIPCTGFTQPAWNQVNWAPAGVWQADSGGFYTFSAGKATCTKCQELIVTGQGSPTHE